MPQLIDANVSESELRLLQGEPAEFVEAHRASAGASDELDFALGRGAKQVGDVDLAEQLMRRVAQSRDQVVAARAVAHLAHVDYYRGRFAEGIRRMRDAPAAVGPAARAEGLLYLSANLIALNDARGALESARAAERQTPRVRSAVLRADLRFRCSRQLVHVLVAGGRYLEAASEAAIAAALASRFGDHRRLGYAAYLLGFVGAARGLPEATLEYAQAETHWRARYPSLESWLRVMWAILLRDLGDVVGAELIRPRSRALPSWEGPLFSLSVDGPPRLPSLDRVPDDERPFLQATRGLVQLRSGDPAGALRDLGDAVFTFDACAMHHYRRGAALTLAFAYAAEGRRETALGVLRREVGGTLAAGLRRWPWWDAHVVTRNRGLLVAAGVPASMCDAMATATYGSLEDSDLLRSRGLTEREIEVVRTWTSNRHFGRKQLAAALGIKESSIRTHLNSVRQKLEVVERGPIALRAHIDALRAGVGLGPP